MKVVMGSFFGRGTRRPDEQEFQAQLEELMRKVGKLEEALQKPADAAAQMLPPQLDALLSGLSDARIDVERKREQLDKLEEEAKNREEKLRAWEEGLKERQQALDDQERRLRQEREAAERASGGGDTAAAADETGTRPADTPAESGDGRNPGAVESRRTTAADSGEENPAGRQSADGAAWKAMEERMDALRKAVEDSAYKDNLIRELHKELQQHRQGMLAEVAKPYLRSVMKIHERLWDTARYYAREEVRKEADAYARFLRKVESDVVAVQDMLEDDFGVSYFEAEAGGEFRPREQHALKTVATTDAAQAGRVAECLYGGFRMEETGKVVKAAQITLYKLDNENK